MKSLVLLALLFAVPGYSQDRQPTRIGKILYRSGQAALVVAHCLDIGSSWGKHETNPLLQGPNQTFGARGASIKIGIVGIGLLAGELITRKNPKLQPYVGIVDLAVAGFETRVAVNNFGYPKVSVK